MINQPGLRAVNLQKARLLDRLHNRSPNLAAELRALKLDWYKVRNQVDEETGEPTGNSEVFIYDEIGGSFGVSALDFVEELNSIDAPEIVVRLNSPGGLLMDGIAIASAIAQHPSKIITRVDGMAASAASLVAVAGDVCEMNVGSQMMIHDVLCTSMGNASDFRALADWLEAQSNNVAEFYVNKAGGDLKTWRNRMLAETWMFAPEAIELGLADGLYSRKKDSDPELEESIEDEVVAEDDQSAVALDLLMNKQHRLTNRGFKYMGRNKAPKPATDYDKAVTGPLGLKNAKDISDADLDRFIAGMTNALGRK